MNDDLEAYVKVSAALLKAIRAGQVDRSQFTRLLDEEFRNARLDLDRKIEWFLRPGDAT